MVEECKRLETGVGPAIAAANQVCKPIWADLALAAIIKPTAISNIKSGLIK